MGKTQDSTKTNTNFCVFCNSLKVIFLLRYTKFQTQNNCWFSSAKIVIYKSLLITGILIALEFSFKVKVHNFSTRCYIFVVNIEKLKSLVHNFSQLSYIVFVFFCYFLAYSGLSFLIFLIIKKFYRNFLQLYKQK